MRYRDLTLEQLEQLEDLEAELHQSEEQGDGHYSQLIHIYREMHSKLTVLAKKDPEQYRDHLQSIKTHLIAYYIKYGTYLKMNHIKDDDVAIGSLKKSINLDKNNSITHYRLGFLSYNEGSQSDSIKEFIGYSRNEFIEDNSKRSGKMDSLLSLNYDSNNNPALIDLHFVIPGKEGFWYISRDQNLDLNVQKANEAAIKNLFSKDQILSM